LYLGAVFDLNIPEIFLLQ